MAKKRPKASPSAVGALAKSATKKTTATKRRSKPAGKREAGTSARELPQASNEKAWDTPPASGGFPVVGIGASAGGLEALTALFQELPPDLGMAFVVVQHLDPKHASMMSELIGRVTHMTVVEATDEVTVRPNHVYVIPPNRNLAILHHRLQLMPRPDDRGDYKPIDFFLQSLARDLGSQAIGVILSGTGTDGTLGMKAIKAEGGITFSQDEESAEYDGMPHSAIAAGYVDFVLRPGELARELSRIGRHPYISAGPAAVVSDVLPEVQQHLSKIFVLLRARTGNDFTYYKHTTIKRRIKRRMMLHKLDRLGDYVKLLNERPAEVEALFQDILINVTGFFRDPEVFEALVERVYPKLFKERRTADPVRIWVCGCSTGEEAYSLAMTLIEHLGEHVNGLTVQIFATDIDEHAINMARDGTYPEGIAADVSARRLKRFFTRTANGYRINKSVRDLCVFAVQNVVKDPPFSRLDMVCCRNLLIYLESVLQKRALQIFHYALKPNGYLLLGSSETTGSHAELFSLLDKKNKIYAKKSLPARMPHEVATLIDSGYVSTPAKAETNGGPVPAFDIQHEAERVLLAEYGPPGVMINEAMEIQHFRGQTGPYLAPTPGVASLNLLKLAHSELTMPLRSLIHLAIKTKKPVRKDGVELGTNGNGRVIDVQVLPLKDPGSGERYFLVLFEPATPRVPTPASGKRGRKPAKDDPRIEDLRKELRTTREYMQAIIEDQEATNEELRSANEEILSSNEELQSTNEELETAKEELQSTNEELATVNDELENRNTELAQVNNDLTNLLSSVNIPIVMLGQDFRIRHFTPAAEKLLNFIGTDVGRPISDIKPNIDGTNLETMVSDVIDSVTPKTIEVQDRGGRWYSLSIRPYKTHDNRIQGAVLAFIDVDESNIGERLRQALSSEERRLAAVVRDSNDAIVVYELDGRIRAWNPAASRLYGYTEEEACRMNVRAIVPPEARAALDEVIERVRSLQSVPPVEAVRVRKDGSVLQIYQVASAIINDTGKPVAIASTEKQANG